MKTLTVFTPTYNRAYCLGQLYESLKRQTCADFEWLVIDDGSSDGTEALVAGWMAEGTVPIRYIRQPNQGMHGAHNTAYGNIETELNVCIDSDDYMPDDAVEQIVSFWAEHGSERFCGFAGLDAHTDGRLVGSPFPEQLRSSTLFDLYYKHGVTGDKKLVYRTELTKRHPYPLFEGEKYVGLAYKYYLLDREYELLLLNEVLCHVEYLADGSSRNMLHQYRRNPKGFAFYRKALLALPFGSRAFKYRQAIHYVSSSLLSRNGRWLSEVPAKLLTLAAVIPGVLLYAYITAKTRKTHAPKGPAHDYPVA
ncbi:glycosyltransferase family 2 protein [Paenibacillus arenilitoris]|uniref:Glycosyltransferase family 2 protein n=1 Tax=Paenibacillus arenilitoris TaxID=2772299 RepID=A0A927CTN9_9BACL|nr:glycosyltransferase family 2 protein [Paenibacillus arenilitoris]MBD2872046.1 glycosyltransferase family 2 protein [Paenibacillus arenilitoris]